MKRKFKVHTGPSLVNQMAEKLREAGLTVTTIGHEYVYGEVEIDRVDKDVTAQVGLALIHKHHTTFGLKAREV